MLTLRALQRLNVGPVSCDVAPGECVAVMGASGAGKSVLLRMVADLDPHDGDAALDGIPAASLPAPDWRAQVTYVAADSGWWSARVGDHFAVAAEPGSLGALGISPEALDWPVARLSTGERQRLALLRAITPRTKALLLDEPTSGLDASNVVRVEDLLRRLLARGLAILLVTHDAAQAARLAHRRFTLAGGRLVQESP